MTYLFRQNSVCQDTIAAHFAACEPAFVLALREQTDIDLYSEKLFDWHAALRHGNRKN